MNYLFETDRLLVREMTDDDLNALKKIVSKHDGSPCDDEYAHRWIDWCKSSYQKYGFCHYAIILKETGEMIGSAGPSMQLIDDEWRPEIGYHIRKDYHRQGLGKEIAIGSRDYFFRTFKDYNEVYSYMDVDNIPSYKTAEAMGMKFLHIYERQGASYMVYSMARDEWNKLR